MPAWLGHTLPELHIEGRPQDHLPLVRVPEPALAG
jgi:hypothetical protein